MMKEEAELKYICEDGFIWEVSDWDEDSVELSCCCYGNTILVSRKEFNEMEVAS